jgi:hypothetical protein
MAKAKFPDADVLLLTAHGTAQLLDADERVLWSSDDDEQFTDAISDEFLEESDVDEILEYLVDANLLTESQEVDLCVDTLEDSDGVDLGSSRGL